MNASGTRRPPLPPVAEVLDGQHLVVTGTTGFVGKVWLAHVLCHVPNPRLTLLVRSGRDQSAAERVAAMIDTSPCFRPLRAQVTGDLGAWLDARLTVLDACLTQPDCGLDDDGLALVADADAVIHLAGLTDFHPDPRLGVPANVDGTENVAALTARTAGRRLVHVSTCYVAGRADGEVAELLTPGVSPKGIVFDVDAEIAEARRIATADTDPVARTEALGARAEALGWPNNYTFTKALAEHLLAATDLDVTITRPSVVESSRTFPFPAWNEGLNTSGPIMWFCGTAFAQLPSTGSHVFDIIPVDAVARWLSVVTARHLRGEAHAVYQFASGDVNPATFDRIVELTALSHRDHARRSGATAWDRFLALRDVQPARWDALSGFTPKTTAQALGGLADRLGDLAPGREATGVAARVRTTLNRTKRQLHTQRRRFERLHRMLDVYRPFIHDHDWRFHTGHIRDETSDLDPDDPFHDDVRDLDWRTYWMEVQAEAMRRWAYPLMEGRTVPSDPPSHPPLRLGATAPVTAKVPA